jgi:hypothetical protein
MALLPEVRCGVCHQTDVPAVMASAHGSAMECLGCYADKLKGAPKTVQPLLHCHVLYKLSYRRGATCAACTAPDTSIWSCEFCNYDVCSVCVTPPAPTTTIIRPSTPPVPKATDFIATQKMIQALTRPLSPPILLTPDKLEESAALFACKAFTPKGPYSPLAAQIVVHMLAEGAAGATAEQLRGLIEPSKTDLLRAWTTTQMLEDSAQVDVTMWHADPVKLAYRAAVGAFGVVRPYKSLSSVTDDTVLTNAAVKEELAAIEHPQVVFGANVCITAPGMTYTHAYKPLAPSPWATMYHCAHADALHVKLPCGGDAVRVHCHGSVSAWLFRPEGSRTGCTTSNVLQWYADASAATAATSAKTVIVARPAFKFADVAVSLTGALQAAGVTRAFDVRFSDLSRASELPLYVSSVVQVVNCDFSRGGMCASESPVADVVFDAPELGLAVVSSLAPAYPLFAAVVTPAVEAVPVTLTAA